MIAELEPATETLAALLEPRKSITGSVRVNARRNAGKGMEAGELFDRMAEISEPLGIQLRQPRWNGNAYEFSDAIIAQLVGDKVGRLKYEGEKVRVHWFETRKKSGVFKHTLTRERHEHLVVEPRFLKLPCKIEMPSRAIEIHRKLCEVPALRRGARVLTGTLVGEAMADTDVWSEDTWLTKSGKAIGRSVSDAANATANAVSQAANATASAIGNATAAASEAAGNITRSASKTGTAVMDTFAIDPAIILGNNVVLFGWRD